MSALVLTNTQSSVVPFRGVSWTPTGGPARSKAYPAAGSGFLTRRPSKDLPLMTAPSGPAAPITSSNVW